MFCQKELHVSFVWPAVFIIRHFKSEMSFLWESSQLNFSPATHNDSLGIWMSIPKQNPQRCINLSLWKHEAINMQATVLEHYYVENLASLSLIFLCLIVEVLYLFCVEYGTLTGVTLSDAACHQWFLKKRKERKEGGKT